MKASTILITLVMTAATIAAVWLMVGHYGLIPGLDFGCGQYYYTDIPNWQKYFSVKGIVDRTPAWVYYLLFFAWGYAMYRLWRRIDRT